MYEMTDVNLMLEIQFLRYVHTKYIFRSNNLAILTTIIGVDSFETPNILYFVLFGWIRLGIKRYLDCSEHTVQNIYWALMVDYYTFIWHS